MTIVNKARIRYPRKKPTYTVISRMSKHVMSVRDTDYGLMPNQPCFKLYHGTNQVFFMIILLCTKQSSKLSGSPKPNACKIVQGRIK